MPVVFVHGVNTRTGAGYEAGLKVKTAFLRKSLAGAKINGKSFANPINVTFPYWGDLATSFAWNMASLPQGDMQALSVAADADVRAFLAVIRDALPGGMAEEPLVAFAKRGFLPAVETIGEIALEHTPVGMEADVAAFVVAVQEYATTNRTPAWLATTTTDLQLLSNLRLAIAPTTQVQAQGLDDILNFLSGTALKIKEAASGMIGTAVDKVGDFASTKLLGWTREPLNATLGRFFGDVFIYFDGRGHQAAPGPIPNRIMQSWEQALTGAPADEPFVVIGHSLGGVITFDLLGHFWSGRPVDLFVSVGSQVAHFEEIKLYRTSDKLIQSPQKAPTPPNITRWINVYDEVDIFSYACKKIFDRVDIDARYDTGTYVIKAHGAYFEQARFYERLRARIDQLP